MKAIFSKVVLILSILFYSSEGFVSGNAGFQLIEPKLKYSFSESSRKKVHTDQYEEYWRSKKVGFIAAVSAASSTLDEVESNLKSLGIEIQNFLIDLDSDADIKSIRSVGDIKSNLGSKNFRFFFLGDLGETVLEIHLKKKLNAEEAEALFTHLKAMQFESLGQNAQKAQVAQNTAKSTQNKKVVDSQEFDEAANSIVEGLAMANYQNRFSMALFLNSWIRRKNLAYFSEILKKEFDAELPRIAADISKLVEMDLLWVDSKSLTSLPEKLTRDSAGKHSSQLTIEKSDVIGLEKNSKNSNLNVEFVKSIFNPYGPLSDDQGRRSIATVGNLTWSLLFVSAKGFNNKEKYESRRASFEEWFRDEVRDPQRVVSEMERDFKTCYAGGSEHDFEAYTNQGEPPEIRLARERVERIMSSPIQKVFFGPKMKKQILEVVLNNNSDNRYWQRKAIIFLRSTQDSERKPIFLKLVKEGKYIGQMAYIAQMGAEVYDQEVVDSLVRLVEDPSVPSVERDQARHGLQSIRNSAKRDGKGPLVKVIDKHLK